ncbi:hypothetical protein Syun_000357 [Stephania yunnanensis]|uniref:ELM2 domain-containing protein n=1 Tax=Stephania yunnanensis TaxID=152371 RepID=A0AAP0Q596_9MAGN
MGPGRISVDKASEVTEEEPENSVSGSGALRWLRRVAVDHGEPGLCSGEAQGARNAEFIKRKRKHDLIVPDTSEPTSKSPWLKSEKQSSVESKKRQPSPASPVPSLRSNGDYKDCSSLTPKNALDFVNQLGVHKKDSSKTLLKDPSVQANTMNEKKPREKETSTADLDTDDSGLLISNKVESQTVKEGHSLVTRTLDSPKSLDQGVSPLVRPNEIVSSSHLSRPVKSQKHQKPRKKTELLSLIRSDDLPRIPIPIGPKRQDVVTEWTGLPKVTDMPDVDLDNSKRLGNYQSPQNPIDSPKLFYDEYTRMAIPVGPRFQAGVQDWTGPLKKTNSSYSDGDLDNSKWLGTKIWSVEGTDIETSTEMIGKRRHHPCSCDSPGSTECTNHHITQERDRLKSELGPAFFSWKFNEMGEQVSCLWTQQEQNRFQNILKGSPMSNSKAFWKTAFKCFPGKSRENIVSYYFNVHVLRQISRQTRLPGAIVDTDNEDDGEPVRKSKNSGSQYLSKLR